METDILESAKLLTAINSGVVVVSIAFIKDLFKEHATNKAIRWAWVLLMLSSLFCVITINFSNNRDPALFCIVFALLLSVVGIALVMYFILIVKSSPPQNETKNILEQKDVKLTETNSDIPLAEIQDETSLDNQKESNP